MGMADDDYTTADILRGMTPPTGYKLSGPIYDYLRSRPSAGPLQEALDEPAPASSPTLGSRVSDRLAGMSGVQFLSNALSSPQGQILAALYAPGRARNARVATPAVSKGQLFDTSRKTLEQVPNVPQVNFPEPTWAKGVPERVLDQGLDKAANLRRMQKDLDAGIEAGGLGWYNNDQLLQNFMAEHGPEKGRQMFHQFMDSVAATSPRSKVPENVRNASFRFSQWMQGEPPPSIDYLPPSPYGHLAQKHHNAHMAELMAEGSFDPLQNPKPMRFAENLAGNQLPVTVDSHATKAAGLRNTKGVLEEVPGPAYGYLSDIYRKLAKQSEITPAQAQSSMWIGAGQSTGLKSPPDPFLKVLEDRVRFTAEREGTSPQRVLRDMIRGKRPLLGVGGAAAAPLGANLLNSDEQ